MVGCARTRTLEDADRCSNPVRVTHRSRRTSVLHPPYGEKRSLGIILHPSSFILHPCAGILPVLLSLLTITVVSLSPPALLANDLAAALSMMASGDQSPAKGGGALRGDHFPSATSPSQAPLVRQEFLSTQTSASTSVVDLALPKQLFSHGKCEGPAAVVPHEPDLPWKGAFHIGRRLEAAANSGVVQTSAELPLDTAGPGLLPNLPRTGRSDRVAVTSGQSLPADPPLPVQIPPAAEPVPHRRRLWSNSLLGIQKQPRRASRRGT